MSPFGRLGIIAVAQLSLAALAAFATPAAQAQATGSASITWSRTASAAFDTGKLAGSYQDATYTAQYINVRNVPVNFQGYSKKLTPDAGSTDNAGLPIVGSFTDTLSWTADAGNRLSTQIDGGSFTLSQLHWDLDSDGSGRIWATASGSIIGTTQLLAFTAPASAVTRSADQVILGTLNMSGAMLDLMAQALSANLAGVGYTALVAASRDMGTLTISAVPETATWAQLGLGLIGLGVLMRRQRPAYKPCKL